MSEVKPVPENYAHAIIRVKYFELKGALMKAEQEEALQPNPYSKDMIEFIKPKMQDLINAMEKLQMGTSF